MKDFNINFKINNNCINKQCSNCGECCTDFLPLTKKEVKVISDYIKEHNIQEHEYVDETSFDLRCPFYNKDAEHHCDIYEVRPLVCRRFKCSLTQQHIDANKNLCNDRAYYNHFDINKGTFNKSFFSLHALFFKNYAYELQAIYSLCKNDEKMFSDILNECYITYNMEGKEDK